MLTGDYAYYFAQLQRHFDRHLHAAAAALARERALGAGRGRAVVSACVRQGAARALPKRRRDERSPAGGRRAACRSPSTSRFPKVASRRKRWSATPRPRWPRCSTPALPAWRARSKGWALSRGWAARPRQLRRSPSRSAPLEIASSGAGSQPPRKGVPPLVLGVGLGVVLVTALGVLSTVFGGNAGPSAAVPSARAPLGSASTPLSTITVASEVVQPRPGVRARAATRARGFQCRCRNHYYGRETAQEGGRAEEAHETRLNHRGGPRAQGRSPATPNKGFGSDLGF